MQLDSYTLLVASCGLLVMFGGAFVFLWLRDRTSVWLMWWCVPIIFTGAALMFYTRDGWQDDFVSIAFGNAARLSSLGCLWYGIRRFQGRKLPWGLVTLIGSAWIGLCLIPGFAENLALRIMVVSLGNAVLCALAVHELWRDRDDGLRSRLPTLLVFASCGLLMTARAALAQVAPFPVGAAPLDPVWLAVFAWLALGHIMFASIFFLAMTMERREAQQRSFAMSDPLTGLLNRRAFGDFAQRMARRRAGLRESMSLLVLDLDHFKEVNDRFGHDAGDKILKVFAEVAEDTMRPSDQLFRMGGEEFCFVLPNTTIADAIAVAERVRQAFEFAHIETINGPAGTTVSIGIAATQFAVDLDVLVAAADAAVYEAKARGRNRVVLAEPSSLIREEAAALVDPARRRA
ncbi:MAG: GGDEF domain-containing protein [Devosia sp.]